MSKEQASPRNVSIFQLITRLGRPVTYYPSLGRWLGVSPTVFLCQLLYWSSRTKDKEGWVYKSTDEFSEETGLSYKEQLRARVILLKHGIVKERHDRLKHRLYFRIAEEALDEGFAAFEESGDEFGNRRLIHPKTEGGAVDQREYGQMTNGHMASLPKVISGDDQREYGQMTNGHLDTKVHRVRTETTAESTKTESTSIPPSARSFISLWMDAYLSEWRKRYILSGQDSSAAKRFISQGGDQHEAIDLAQRAWRNPKGFNCRRSRTLYVFLSVINALPDELGTGSCEEDVTSIQEQQNVNCVTGEPDAPYL